MCFWPITGSSRFCRSGSFLPALASNICQFHGTACVFRYDRSILVDDISVCTHLYSIVHEAIHNAIRHGRADRIEIELRYDGCTVTLAITDNGSGMSSTEQPQGMGLKIMNFRAAMIGAELKIDSAPGRGTRVTLSFRHDDRRGGEPLQKAEDAS